MRNTILQPNIFQVFLIKDILIINSDNTRIKDDKLTIGQAKKILQETTLIGTQVTQGFINCLFTYLIKTFFQNSDEQALQKSFFLASHFPSEMVSLSNDEN